MRPSARSLWTCGERQPAQPSDLDNCASRKGSYFSPSIASEPSIKSSSSATQENRVGHGKQANITPGREQRVVCRKAGISHHLRFLLPLSLLRFGRPIGTIRPLNWLELGKFVNDLVVGCSWRHAARVGTAAEPNTELPDQAASTPAVTLTPTKEFTELNQQLQTVVNDLAVLRRNVEQLSERQEQMSRDISTVQAIEQNVSEKISSLAQAAPVPVPPRKNVPRLVHAETPRQPAAASGPSQPSTVGTASPTDQPPRPPMPLPTPAETSSPLH